MTQENDTKKIVKAINELTEAVRNQTMAMQIIDRRKRIKTHE